MPNPALSLERRDAESELAADGLALDAGPNLAQLVTQLACATNGRARGLALATNSVADRDAFGVALAGHTHLSTCGTALNAFFWALGVAGGFAGIADLHFAGFADGFAEIIALALACLAVRRAHVLALQLDGVANDVAALALAALAADRSTRCTRSADLAFFGVAVYPLVRRHRVVGYLFTSLGRVWHTCWSRPDNNGTPAKCNQNTAHPQP